MVFYKFYRDQNGFVCEHLNNGKSIIKYDESAYDQLTSLFKRKYYAVNLVDNKMTYTNGTDRIIIDEFTDIIKTLPADTFDLVVDNTTKYMLEVYNSIVASNLESEVKEKRNIGKLKLCLTTAFLTTMLLPLNLQRNVNVIEPYALAMEKYMLLQNEEQDRVSDTIESAIISDEPLEVIKPNFANSIESLEDLENENNSLPTYDEPQVTSDNRIYLTNIPQTGISRSYTNYSYFYNRWSSSSRQRKVADIWGALGFTSDRGIATINGRYVVAVTTTYGQVGDCINIALSNGVILPCVIGDAKSSNDQNWTPYGHRHGNVIEIVEWDSSGAWEDIDISDIAGLSVTYIEMTGVSILNQPIEAYMIDNTDVLEEETEIIEEFEESMIDPSKEALENIYEDGEIKVYTLSN